MGRRARAGRPRAKVGRLLAAIAPCASGSGFVLRQYEDSTCTTLHRGLGTQQSWMRTGGDHTSCYHLMAGFACQFQCFVRMRCEYGSGSGVLLEDMMDDTCTGQVTGTRNLATHWTWLQAKHFFDGDCIQLDASTWLKFDTPLGESGYPNCEAEGAVATGGGDSPNAFQGQYALQFYTNNLCTEVYTPSTYSTQTSSRFNWRVHRGAQYCYDYIDETPRDSDTAARHVPQSIYNFKLVCGNTDMMGNGIRVTRYDGTVCSGRSAATEDWRAVFYPMNFPEVSRFFAGECVPWSTYFVKFDKAWQRAHYPDCADHACEDGYCAGGRIVTSVWSAPSGTINTMPLSAAAAAAAEGGPARARGCLRALAWLASALAAVRLGG